MKEKEIKKENTMFETEAGKLGKKIYRYLCKMGPKGASQEDICDAMHRKELSQYIDLQELDDTDLHLRQLLAQTYKNYKGYIGVDMMICSNNDYSYSLHPCVEINMRMNMGVLCSIITKKFVEEGKGPFRAYFYAKGESGVPRVKFFCDVTQIYDTDRKSVV